MTAVDAGDNAAISGFTTDLGGNCRIKDGNGSADVDMGAYEFGTEPECCTSSDCVDECCVDFVCVSCG